MNSKGGRGALVGHRLGVYEIHQRLGAGGMGEVYRARDTRLGRDVAVKVLVDRPSQGSPGNDDARARLWREARAAASVNHPAICQIHEIGEAGGHLFVAMELLEGEPLEKRIAGGPIELGEAVGMAVAILGALDAIHRRGIVHRDLKPSNVFLTPFGVKLLDFGLARPLEAAAGELHLTQPGAVVGTPRYMAPEQWEGRAPDSRSDIFAVGALLFEMLAGRPAFQGATVPEIYHAVTSMHPPALSGSAGIAAVDAAIHRALEKRPDERYQTAAAMAEELQRTITASDTTAHVRARATTRLIALPFRMLRPDPDLEFLAFSLPDAVTSSLAGLESLVVRSTIGGARYTNEIDLSRIASEASVDVVLSGTLLRDGGQVRVMTQLIEVPAGTILWSRHVQAELRDLFQIQDELVRAIVTSLSLPLSSRERKRSHDLPASARAYELYLRANQISYDPSSLAVAEQLYRSALAEDPNYGPAWARLGRIHRVLAKYGHGPADWHREQAEAAFNRALQLNPDLSVVHNLYTNLEVETLGRARPAMRRLLERARSSPADPDLFTGLVLACRYCGLLAASLAADRHARRLDPGIRTSVSFTHFMLGDWQRAIATEVEETGWVTKFALPLVGREADAAAAYLETERRDLPHVMRLMMKLGRLALAGQRDESIEIARQLTTGRVFDDPEGLYFVARNLARVGAPEMAIGTLEQVVERGFHCDRILRRDPWLDPVRGEPRFKRIVGRVDALVREAEAEYLEDGGEQLLGSANQPPAAHQ